MGRPERRVDQTAAIGDQPHREIVHAQIDRDLLVAAPGDEGRDRVDVWQITVERHAGGHADDILLGDAFHVIAVGVFGLHAGEQAGAEIGADEDDLVVLLRQLIDHVDACLTHQFDSSAA